MSEASASSTPRLFDRSPDVAAGPYDDAGVEPVPPPPLRAASSIALTSCAAAPGTAGTAATGAPGISGTADVPARRAAIALALATASAWASIVVSFYSAIFVVVGEIGNT